MKQEIRTEKMLLSSWLTILLILFILGIIGCGSDDSGSLTSTAVQGSNINETTMLSTYRKTCVDDNQPIIEAQYQSCLSLWSTYNGPNPCQTNKDLSTAAVLQAWSSLTSQAKANYDFCMSDFRGAPNWCAAKYEEEVAFEVGLTCYSATIR